MTWIVIACSGPGAMAAIERNEAWGWKMFAIAAVVALATASFAIVKKRASIWLWLTIGTTVVHPAVWMGTRSGDCGHMLYFAAIFATVQAALFALVAVLRIRASTHSEGSARGSV